MTSDVKDLIPYLKGLLVGGGSISILTYESYHYALSRERAQVAGVLHGTCAMHLGPING